MFYSVTNSSYRFNDINTLFGQSNLKALVMINCEYLEFSLKGMFLAASQISMSRQVNKSCCNSSIQCSICPRPHMFDKNPGLNTSKYEYSIIIRAPPAGNDLFYTNLNMQCPIFTKLHMFDKTPDLKRSK